MLKAIFITLYSDIRTFVEAYFFKATSIIVENFFIVSEWLKKVLDQRPIFIFVRWLGLFCLFIVHILIWLIWILLPVIISIALYYGRLF